MALILGIEWSAPAQQIKKAETKKLGEKMNHWKFDHSSYGKLNEGEIQVTLHLKIGRLEASVKKKPKPGMIELPEPTDGSIKSDKVLVSLAFANKSNREIHIENRLWFTRLTVKAAGTTVAYVGPMASMPPPDITDFTTLKPGQRFETEPIDLQDYYKIPEGFKGVLQASYQHSPQVPLAIGNLSIP